MSSIINTEINSTKSMVQTKSLKYCDDKFGAIAFLETYRQRKSQDIIKKQPRTNTGRTITHTHFPPIDLVMRVYANLPLQAYTVHCNLFLTVRTFCSVNQNNQPSVYSSHNNLPNKKII